ncbi:hypothetical protein ANN_23092 [Periplaneta americana]|uniref:Reverse transcriptase domain-containing protein n=1 Tax=Periplaneta americana TaxID=6978 RepID=A0ABQ8SK50_PERAM|nr:hypothetical protein ANN_23092 [Periplaneta americana]
MIIRDLLLDLNDKCEQYGLKVNSNKSKIMIVGRRVKKLNLRIRNEAVEQMDNCKYLECTINSTRKMSCCQKVKRETAIPKEAFNRKRSIFCGPLEKKLRKRLMKCFVWGSVALFGAETWTLGRSKEKQLEAFELWIWRRMEHVKRIDIIRNEAVLERVDEERMLLKLIRKRERNWLGHWLRKNCLLKDALEEMVNGRKVRGRRRHQMLDFYAPKEFHFCRLNFAHLFLSWYPDFITVVAVKGDIKRALRQFIPRRRLHSVLLGVIISATCKGIQIKRWQRYTSCTVRRTAIRCAGLSFVQERYPQRQCPDRKTFVRLHYRL